MDAAVALVQAYLRVNGYFTVAEYPIIEAAGGNRALTDVDILAFRLADVGRRVPDRSGGTSPHPERHQADSYLGASADRADMLIGEVKEGRARLNRAARDPVVIQSALVRFGCCSAEEARQIVKELAGTGRATTAFGHQIRLVVFGSTLEDERDSARFTFIPLGAVVRFLEQHIREHWEVVSHVQTTEPALGFLLTLEKARRGLRGAAAEISSSRDPAPA